MPKVRLKHNRIPVPSTPAATFYFLECLLCFASGLSFELFGDKCGTFPHTRNTDSLCQGERQTFYSHFRLWKPSSSWTVVHFSSLSRCGSNAHLQGDEKLLHTPTVAFRKRNFRVFCRFLGGIAFWFLLLLFRLTPLSWRILALLVVCTELLPCPLGRWNSRSLRVKEPQRSQGEYLCFA